MVVNRKLRSFFKLATDIKAKMSGRNGAKQGLGVMIYWVYNPFNFGIY
jgi:hypothetical protein